MTCYHPVTAWRSQDKNQATGKRGIVFSASGGFGLPIKLPCQGCIGCRLDRSREWAQRVVHEASRYPENVFLTLTYDDANLPPSGSISKEEIQLFQKRLRFHFRSRKLRFFSIGEYGDRTGRPHYHSIVFNCGFNDQIQHKKTDYGTLFRSPTLDRLWGKGHCLIGQVSFHSAAYVARYALKKITGDRAQSHYERTDAFTGEIHRLEPEFALMSRRPGLGLDWFQTFKTDCYPSDFLIHQGGKTRIPRYYDKKIPEVELALLKEARKLNAKKFRKENTPERLKVREIVKKAQLQQLKRESQ